MLFIDDEKHIRQANKQTLELANLDVIIEDCAEKGLEILTREWPGVVVCDIRLPQMDGLQFLVEVQKIDHDLPVILITGHGDVPLAVAALKAGGTDGTADDGRGGQGVLHAVANPLCVDQHLDVRRSGGGHRQREPGAGHAGVQEQQGVQTVVDPRWHQRVLIGRQYRRGCRVPRTGHRPIAGAGGHSRAWPAAGRSRPGIVTQAWN